LEQLSEIPNKSNRDNPLSMMNKKMIGMHFLKNTNHIAVVHNIAFFLKTNFFLVFNYHKYSVSSTAVPFNK
jgi:hypothetical protein